VGFVEIPVNGAFSGRTVVLVGAAGGIGAATASALVQAGATVVLADAREDALYPVVAALARRGRAIGVAADVTRMPTLDRLREAALAAYGRVDAVVNCAAILVPGAPDALALHDVTRQIETNLLGTVLVTRAFLPYFRERRRGHLLHLASLGGIVPMPHEAIYCATKFAVRGFCHALALELRGTGIAVSVVCPDSTNTRQLAAEAGPHGSPMSFLSEPLDPGTVAAAVVATLERPRLEVLVPRGRGWTARLLAYAPGALQWLYPLLERQGRRGRDRFAATRIAAGTRS
jgi:NAD(P)-dependent dehydrogenase (short-subunit alcohol dehydrogenase family)